MDELRNLKFDFVANDDDTVAHYAQFYNAAFRAFFGWSDSQCEKLITLLDLREDIFLAHETPMYNVASIMGVRPVGGRARCRREIDQAIHGGDHSFGGQLSPDWAAAKMRVEQYLASVGLSLAEVGRELEERFGLEDH